MSNIVEINNLKEYIEAIISSEDMDNSNQYYYRGEPRFYYELKPSVARNTCLLNEKKLINNAKQLYPHIFRKELSPIELLITLQHYGIPTRLLDITTNALVALFFACNEPKNEYVNNSESNKDGKVYIFHNIRNNIYDGLENILSRSYQLPTESIYIDKYIEFIKSYPEYNDIQFIINLEIAQNVNKENNANDFFSYETNKILTREIRAISDNPIFINPPMLFDRMRLQAGNFILFFNSINQEQNNSDFLIESNIKKLCEKHIYIKKIIKIKDESKEEILKHLKSFNISERTLFYDNIDKNCEIIKKSICGA